MPLKTGDRVSIAPLNGKPGRVVGSQSTSRRDTQLYLVRYEVDPGISHSYSQVSAYFDDELKKIKG